MEVITLLVILRIFTDFTIFKIIFSIVFIDNLSTCKLKSYGANAKKKDNGQRERKQYQTGKKAMWCHSKNSLMSIHSTQLLGNGFSPISQEIDCNINHYNQVYYEER